MDVKNKAFREATKKQMDDQDALYKNAEKLAKAVTVSRYATNDPQLQRALADALINPNYGNDTIAYTYTYKDEKTGQDVTRKITTSLEEIKPYITYQVAPGYGGQEYIIKNGKDSNEYAVAGIYFDYKTGKLK